MRSSFVNRRNRHANVSRRTVVRCLVGGVLGGSIVGTLGRGGSGRNVDASPDSPSLSIAMLDRHWVDLQEAIDGYAHGRGISIRVDPLPLGALYETANLVLTQTGNAYDLMILPDQWIPQFASFLTPVSVPQAIETDYVPSAWQVARHPADGPTVGLPWSMEVQVFGMQNDLRSTLGISAPESWDDTLGVVTAIDALDSTATGGAGFGMRTSTSYDMFESFLPILRGYGRDLLDPATQIPRLDTAESVASLEMFLALARSSPAESSGIGEPTNVDRFVRGEIAMMSNLWSRHLLETDPIPVRSPAAGIDVRRQPAQPGVARGVLAGIWIAAIPLGSMNPEVALAFGHWLIDETMQRSMTDLHLLPVRQSMFPSELPGGDQTAETWKQLAVAATPRLRSPYYAQVEQLVASEVGRALQGIVSPAEAMKQANLAVRAFLLREGVLDG